MDKVADAVGWSLLGAAIVWLCAHLIVHGQDYLNDLIPFIDQLRRTF